MVRKREEEMRCSEGKLMIKETVGELGIILGK